MPRALVRRALATLLVSFAFSGLVVPTRAEASPQLRALWVDAFNSGIKNPAQVAQLVADAKRGGFNALVVQVRRRGDAYYQSSIEPRAQDAALAPAPYDPLATLLDAAHAQGIEVHAWIATLSMWKDTLGVPSAPEHLYWQHGPGVQGGDNWVALGVNGETGISGDTWLDPGHPAAAAHTVAVASDLLAHYPSLDGLQLDLVRYASPQFGYNPVSVARFNERYGRTGRPDPADALWAQWRREQVTNLVRHIGLEAAQIAPQVRFSVAAIAIGKAPTQIAGGWEASDPYKNRLQDWRGWLAEGILDSAFVMNYDREADANQRSWYRAWVDWEAGQAASRSVVVGHGAWLNSPSGTIAQIDYAVGAGASGVASYAYSDLSGDSSTRAQTLDALRAGPFAQPVAIPQMPWRWQTGGISGDLWAASGSIATDGAVINLSGPLERTLVSDGAGWFGASNLPPGSYTLSVNLGNGAVLLGSAEVWAGGVAGVAWQTADLEPQGWLPLVER